MWNVEYSGIQNVSPRLPSLARSGMKMEGLLWDSNFNATQLSLQKDSVRTSWQTRVRFEVKDDSASLM
ncbi:hypothetical protein N7539_008386 [Penicillium diatomitis]|uniref:Uncharacterized protein n=1 Tax=Penicillium diatomitis TaxID=2819901 RepID=A0A9W9WTN4_9EURO|nr:uncharacterized protein N7539_008386 [Penicillium diatomitis]KAJ5475320.1 hypothetical protein N7539_008386 [Penicillium diatomitis]